MTMNRIDIGPTDHIKLGALIKKWARAEVPLPQTKAELEAQFAIEDITPSWPDGDNVITEVNVFQGATNRLDLRVPPLSFITDSEKHIKANGYSLPSYYKFLFDGAEPNFNRYPDLIDFHNQRVGDYTIANCI